MIKIIPELIFSRAVRTEEIISAMFLRLLLAALITTITSIYLLMILLLIIPLTKATPLNCTFRTTCQENETAILRAENITGGYWNAHVQLINYTGAPYSNTLCCESDQSHKLNNSCEFSRALTIINAYNITNSHIELPTLGNYNQSICLGVDYGNLTCAYINGTCPEGYTGMFSMASSEFNNGYYNQTNAHISNYTQYLLSVCCEIGNAAPVILSLILNSSKGKNTSSENLTAWATVYDADSDNVSTIYDWRINGTSIAVINMNFDINNSAGNGRVKDYSTNGNDGTLGNGTESTKPYWNATGGFNRTGAYRFDGIDDYIQLPSNLGYGDNISVFGWFKREGTPSGGYHIVFGGQELEISIPESTGALRTGVYTDARYVSNSGSGLTDNNWHFIGFTFNTTTKVSYIDGVPVGSQEVSGGPLTKNFTRTMGRFGTSTTYYANATLDEWRIYNRTLTPYQILLMYRNESNIIDYHETSHGDNWSVCVTPNDGLAEGPTVCSENLTINRSVPSIPILIYPSNGNDSVFERNVTLDWLPSYEGDGDQINYTVNLTIEPGSCAVEQYQENITEDNFTTNELCTDQSYNWSVRACDIDGCSEWAASWNFTIASVLGIRFLQNNTDFGTLNMSSQVSTLNGNGTPLVVENTGNIMENIDIKALDPLFSSVSLNTTYFEYLVAENESGSYTAGQDSWTNITANYTTAFINMSYIDSHDDGKIHLNVTVPDNEPPGAKNSTIIVRVSAT